MFFPRNGIPVLTHNNNFSHGSTDSGVRTAPACYPPSSSSSSAPVATAYIGASYNYRGKKSHNYAGYRNNSGTSGFSQNFERYYSSRPSYDPNLEPDIYVGDRESEDYTTAEDAGGGEPKFRKTFREYTEDYVKDTYLNIRVDDHDRSHSKEEAVKRAVFQRLKSVDIPRSPSRRIYRPVLCEERVGIKVDRSAMIRESSKSFGECYKTDDNAV